MPSKPNNALPVYSFTDNHGKPLNNSQMQTILNNPTTKIVSAYDSNIKFTPSTLPNGNTLLPPIANKPPRTAYRVASWCPEINTLAYHNKSGR